MLDILSDYTLRTILLGTMSLGLFCAVLGTFAVLRKQSLVGDTLAHAALPGVCLGYLATNTKSPAAVLIGATVTCAFAMFWVHWSTKYARNDWNTSLGIVLTSMFGLGVVFLSYIQRGPSGGQAGLDTFLFGQAASLVEQTVLIITVIGVLATIVLIRIQQPYQLLAFDPTFARASGLNIERIETIQTMLLIAGVIIGLNTVGVVLLSAMLVAPALAARPWIKNSTQLLILAAVVGLVSSGLGAIVSSRSEGLPTGPVVVVTLAILVSLSLFGHQVLKSARRVA